MMTAIVFLGVQNGLNDTIRHPETNDGQGVPEPTVKYHVPHIPYPFETKRKHLLPPRFRPGPVEDLLQAPLDYPVRYPVRFLPLRSPAVIQWGSTLLLAEKLASSDTTGISE